MAGLAAVGAFGFWWNTNAKRTDLVVGDAEIANPGQMVDEAEGLLRAAADADGAVTDDDVGCFFAPSTFQPMVVCGPVWFGVSPEDQPWIEMATSYTSADDGTVVGLVDDINGPRNVDRSTFNHHDGDRPVEPGPATYPTSGLRTRNGARIENPDAVLQGAEAELEGLVQSAEMPITTSAESACFFHQRADRLNGMAIVDNELFCGPARTTSSAADEIWLPVPITFADGATFGSVAAESFGPASARLRSLGEGEQLLRPDGGQPTDASNVDRPAQPGDFAAVVDYRLVPESGGGMSGELVTSSYRLTFDRLARVDEVGTGARSFRAADGFDLVVAAFGPNESGYRSPRGSLVVNGQSRPLPQWRESDEGGTLIVSVPESARTVELREENDGRPQTLSLLDGSLAPGYPLALYRPKVDLSRPFAERVEMPVGEPVLIEGVLAGAEWSAKADGEWLPEGTSRLTVEFDGWNVNRPCCEVSIGQLTTTFSLVARGPAPDSAPDPDSDSDPAATDPDPPAATTDRWDDLRDSPTDPPQWSAPVFEVPEDLTSAVLRMEVAVPVAVDGTESVNATVIEFELELP